MSHILTAIRENTPAAQLYLWVIKSLNYKRIIYRARAAARYPNAVVKLVLFEINIHDRLLCGMPVLEAFRFLHGTELIEKLLSEKSYIRRKPLRCHDGTSHLSNTEYQVVVVWNTDVTPTAPTVYRCQD
jgi:hypothetical protein